MIRNINDRPFDFETTDSTFKPYINKELKEAYEQGKKDAQEECDRCIYSGYKEQMKKHDREVRDKAIDECIEELKPMTNWANAYGYVVAVRLCIGILEHLKKEQKDDNNND